MKRPIYKIDAFFAGVGGIELGFEQTGRFTVQYANEFDKFARQTYQFNRPQLTVDERDIHDVKSQDLPDCDVMMGGFPCQAFSLGGYRKGFADPRGTLFFEMLRMIKAKQPRVVMFENVKNLVAHDKGNTFKVILQALVENHYYVKWQVLNSKDYGDVPQNRERIYIVGFLDFGKFQQFEFPKPILPVTTLRDVIDFKHPVDSRYYYGPQFKFYPTLQTEMTNPDHLYQWRRYYLRENKSGVSPTLTANMGTGGHNVPLIITDDKRIRKLTPRETFNLQGYPKDFKLPPTMSNGQLYKQAGNSVSVPVIHRIAQRVLMALTHSPQNESLNPTGGKYDLWLVHLHGQFVGNSYIQKTFAHRADLVQYIQQRQVTVSSETDYLKALRKNKPQSLYLVIQN